MNAIPFSAITRLNVHARAVHGCGGLARAIYAYKHLAALIAAAEGKAKLRFIRWAGKCNRCTAGRYSHWGWSDGHTVACRDCSGTGFKKLYFTETTLSNGDVWHNPWGGYPGPGREIAQVVLGDLKWLHGDVYHTTNNEQLKWEDPGEWRPLLPAEQIQIAQLVPLLNEVEDWVSGVTVNQLPGFNSTVLSKARRCMSACNHTSHWDQRCDAYHLDLGRDTSGCHVCRTTENLATYDRGCMTKQFHWSVQVCNDHTKAPFPEGPPPASLITPDVQKWIERHQKPYEVVR